MHEKRTAHGIGRGFAKGCKCGTWILVLEMVDSVAELSCTRRRACAARRSESPPKMPVAWFFLTY